MLGNLRKAAIIYFFYREITLRTFFKYDHEMTCDVGAREVINEVVDPVIYVYIYLI